MTWTVTRRIALGFSITLILLALVATLSMILTSTALADQLQPDSDTLTTGTDLGAIARWL